MNRVMIFAGTTEGRTLAQWCAEHQIPVCISVATEYGHQVLEDSLQVTQLETEGDFEVQTGYLDLQMMVDYMQNHHIDRVIDATHPYAQIVTENIQAACGKLNLPYTRLIRQSVQIPLELIEKKQIITVSSPAEAKAILDHTEGNILLTTGSKELNALVDENNQNRVFVRVLPSIESIEICLKQGISMKQIIAMQGPFSTEINTALLKQFHCRYLVTKESGNAGGFLEKMEACAATGMTAIVIGRPFEETGMTMEQIMEKLIRENPDKQENIVSIVGIGMGTKGTLTADGRKTILDAEAFIGGKRMLKLAMDLTGTDCDSLPENYFAEYNPEKIHNWICSHPLYKKIAVLMSGDTGFYSGAARLQEELKEFRVVLIPGISSVAYFSSRIGISWDNMKLCSMHGKQENLVEQVKHHKKVFSLIGKGEEIADLCRELCENGLRDVNVFVGEQLAYPEEKITCGTAWELMQQTGQSWNSLSAVVVVNDKFEKERFQLGIAESQFIRDKVPMTKEEIRCISIAKLELEKDSVIYDIGAGTGSVSVEMALAAWQGQVFAVEKKKMAIDLLKQNKAKFHISNMEIVEGEAPEMLENLPAPTHVFIGGSGGNLKEIMKLLFQKNPEVRIVINAIALETIAEISELEKEFSEECEIELLWVSVAKAKEVGAYHLMMGQNPVMIAVFSPKQEPGNVK